MPYRTALDWLSFFLADVRGGLGPYVGIFLLTEAHWDQAMIGGVLTISGLIGISLHTPVGALIDATRRKRELIIVGVVLLAVSAIMIERRPTWPVVLMADIAMAVLGAIFAPTLAAITLGLVPSDELASRIGRNAVFDRAGNLFVAGIAGVVGWWLSQRAVFYLVPLFAALTVFVVLVIPANAIDHERARGGLIHEADPGSAPHPADWRILYMRRPFLVLAAGAALFHFANAPMLPLLGQKLALAHPGEETLLMSACIVTAQLVMIPMALLISARADHWGRKPLLLIALAALPIRGVLYTVSDDRSWLVGVQILDGVGLGLFDTLLPLVLADVMRGTGRYNVSRGVIGTIQGIGGSLSNGVAGLIVVRAGYDTAFLVLAALAAMALFLIWVAMPETRRSDDKVAEVHNDA